MSYIDLLNCEINELNKLFSWFHHLEGFRLVVFGPIKTT